MSHKYKYLVHTRLLSKEECKTCLDEIIDILKTNRVSKVDILFGIFWGNDYKNWTPIIVSPDNITEEIDKANNSGAGNFYNDDTFFTLPDFNCKILFCHEYDIHLDYDEPNKVVNDIIEGWKTKNWIYEKDHPGLDGLDP